MATAPTPTGQPSEGNHRSRSPRQKIESLMYVNLGLENGGFPINVSEGGMAFHGVRPMRKDQILQIKFTLPGQNVCVESAAQIAWLNELGKGGGLHFIDLPETSQRLIKNWLSSQASIHGITEKKPVVRMAVDTILSKAIPASQPTGIRDRSSRKIYSSVARESAPFLPVEVAKIITPGDLVAISARHVELLRAPEFREPRIKLESRSLWSVSFPFFVVSSLGLAVFLGLASYSFNWSFEIPATIPNPVGLFSQFAPVTAPWYSSDVRSAAAPQNAPASSGPVAPQDAGPGFNSSDAQEVADAAEFSVPESRPAKKLVPLKMKPPRISSRHMGTTAGRMTPKMKEKSSTAEVVPPTVMSAAKPELTAQLPSMPPAAPPPAPATREAAPQASTFEAAKILARTSPVYPSAVRGTAFSGSVELHFIIGVDGSVRDVTAVKGNLLLAHAAKEAVLAWRYKPARRDGVAVESESSMTFVFDSN